MKVVLDSNIIIADWHFESPNFKIILESSKSGKLDVYIPEVVLDEVINKYSQRLYEAKSKVDSQVKSFNKITRSGLGSDLTKDLIEDSVKVYQKSLHKKIKDNKITLLSYPNPDHKFLALKAMQKKKPFNVNEKGYRDCLIWENVKSLITTDEDAAVLPEVVFITDNSKDFAVNDYELHPDLVKELINEDYNEKSIELQSSLSEFNDKTGKLFFAQAKAFEARIKNNQIWNFDLKSLVIDYLFENYVGSELWDYDVDVPYANDSPTVSSINDEDFEIEITSVKKLNSKEFILDIHFEIDSEIDFFVEKHHYWSADNTKFSIQDADWNKWVMLASDTMLVPISMTIILDINMKVVSAEINTVNDRYKW